MTISKPGQILVDARPLIDPAGGGIPRVTHQLLIALIDKYPEIEWTFVTTGMKPVALPKPFCDLPTVSHCHIRIPNKIWSALCILGTASIDRSASKKTGIHFDVAILPNLGFSGFLEIPYALILHDLSFHIHPGWFSKKMQLWHLAVNPKELAGRADRVFCVSETTAHDAHSYLKIPQDHLRVFHPQIPAEIDRDTNILSSTPRPYALVLGGGDPRKNTATAYDAIRALREDERFQNLHLVHVGACHESRSFLSRKKNPAFSEPWMISLPHPTDAELQSLYEHASAFLYPSWYEGFGLPLHEASRFGIPCVASTHGALPETAPKGTVFAPPAKPQIWTRAIREILLHPDLHKTSFDARMTETDLQAFGEWLGEKGG